MENVNFDSQEIQITSVYFRQDGNEVRFQSFPRQLTYQGRKYILTDA